MRNTPADHTPRWLPPLLGSCACLWLLCSLPIASWANKDEPFTASVDKTVVYLGQTIQLTVTVRLYKRWYSSLHIPKHRSFQVKKRRKKKLKESIFVGGGVKIRNVWLLHITLKPRKAGYFTLSKGTLRVGRKRYTTPPIKIEVRKGTPSNTTPGSDGLPAYIKPQGDVFLLPVLTPDQVFVGQQATLSYYLFKRIDGHIDRPRMPRLPDFWSHPLVPIHPLADWKTRFVNKKRYSYTLALRYALFPLHPGRLQVEGLSFRMQRGYGNQVDQGTVFKSPKVSLQALPLPTKGRPTDFPKERRVGRYKLSAKLSHTTIPVGEPITYTLHIRGTGNIGQLPPPTFPQQKEMRLTVGQTQVSLTPRSGQLYGHKQITYTLQFNTTGTKHIPALSMPFFDPFQQTYQTIQTKPQTIKVTAKTTDTKTKSAPLDLTKPRTDDQMGAVWSSLLGQTTWMFGGGALLLLVMGVGFVALRKEDDEDDDLFEASLPHDSKGTSQASPETPARAKTKAKKKRPLFAPKPPSEEGFQAAKAALSQWLQRHQQPDAQAMKQLEGQLDQLWQAWLGQPVRGLRRQHFLAMLKKQPDTTHLTETVKVLLEASDVMRFSPLPAQLPPVAQYVHQLLQQLPPSITAQQTP